MIVDAKWPDWRAAARQLPVTIASALIRAAVEMVVFDCQQIRFGQKLDGSPQKENSQSRARYKQKHLGHSTPLVDLEVLSDPKDWRINGEPATKYIETFQRKAVFRQRRYGMEAKLQLVSVRLPSDRQSIAIKLAQLGYSIPFGPSSDLGVRIRPHVELELVSEAERIVFELSAFLRVRR